MRLRRVPILAALLLGLTLPAGAAHPMEQQFEALVETLAGKRVGLLTNPSGVDGEYRHISSRLIEHPKVELVAFFAPEHGIHGDLQAGDPDEDAIDSRTGLPVYSLYGPRRHPTAAQLEEVDVVLFDMQSLGVRFYTRQWIMTWTMEACAEHGKSFIVLDRPNPLGLNRVEGAPISFDAGIIGRKWPDAAFGVPVRHGMTTGELAILVNEEWMEPKVDLTVIPVPGLTREMSFEETGYPWVPPSPNIPTVDSAIVYPGLCVLEASNASEGRGTTRPFELLGAPWVDGVELARELNAQGLPGCIFRPAWFRPSFSKHEGELCGGVQVHVTDREAFEPVRTGLVTLKVMLELYPEELRLRDYMERLMGVRDIHERILSEDPDAIIAGWQEDLAAFLSIRQRHLLYP